MSARERRRRRTRVPRDKVVGIVLALACLAFSAVGIGVNQPPSFEYVTGVRNEPVAINQAEVTAGDLRVGTRLIRNNQVVAETSGMFVHVEVALAVPGRQAVTLNNSHLVTQTRTYDNWLDTILDAEPGFRQRQALVFEVDPAQIDDLTLEIWSGKIVSTYHQRARIHLGITADNADQWRQAARGRDVEVESFPVTEALR